jgi:hypothetical protein
VLKDETIDCLQGNVKEMNLNLLTSAKMLESKEQLIQNLQSQNSELQRQLESEVIENPATFVVHVPHVGNYVMLK